MENTPQHQRFAKSGHHNLMLLLAPSAEVENGKGKGGSGSGGGATSRGRNTARGSASMAPSATLEQVQFSLASINVAAHSRLLAA
jgi:hypothetical protein